MDTRTKIISFSDIATLTSQGRWLVIAGNFDPLTIDSAEYIAQLANLHPDRKVLVGVIRSTPANLPADARALLVAALRRVHAVALIDDVDHLPEQARVAIAYDSETDRRHTNNFVQVVLEREKAGA